MSKKKKGKKGRKEAFDPEKDTGILRPVDMTIAAGEIKDVKEAREVIANSFEISYFEPHDTEMWDEGYERFQKIVNM